MDLRKVKRFSWVIVVLVIVLIGVGVWGLATSLVKKGRSVEDIVVKISDTERPTIIPTEKVTAVPEEPMQENEDKSSEYTGWVYPEKVYDGHIDDSDIQSFLGNDFTEYIDVLKKIRSDYKKELEVIEKKGVVGDKYTIYKDSVFEKEIFGNLGYTITGEGALTIVDMFDDTVVVFILGYPENKEEKVLFVADYSDILVEDFKGVFEIGDSIELMFNNESTKVVEEGGFSIVYVKGV